MPAAHHRIVMIYFHPAWRRPWGNPERKLRIEFLGGAYQRDNAALVAFYIEIPQFKVPGTSSQLYHELP